jgi:Domain of unknown function (DUF4333)
MTSPYGPPGGNDPQQWGQQPQQPGAYPGTPSGGFPEQPGQQPQQQWGQQPGAYQQPGQQGQQYGQPGAYGQPPQGVPGQQPQWGQQPGQQPQQQQAPQWGQQPGQPQQQWGQQPGQFGGYGQPQPTARKKSPVLLILIAVVVVLIAVVAFLGFVSPGFFNKRVLDSTAVQNGVTTVLKDNYKVTAANVSCPADQPVKQGTTFTCTATVDGQQKSVQITVKSSDGHYEVGQPQ